MNSNSFDLGPNSKGTLDTLTARERAVRCSPECWWQRRSVCLPVFWYHHQGMRSSARPETARQEGGPPGTTEPAASASLPRGKRWTPGTGFYLHLLRCELIWEVMETHDGKTQRKPRSLEFFTPEWCEPKQMVPLSTNVSSKRAQVVCPPFSFNFIFMNYYSSHSNPYYYNIQVRDKL